MCALAIESLDWTLFNTGPWAPPALPQLSALPPRAEFAVIGAGITGLSCAMALAQAGRDVVILERAFGQGAACRSGGIIIGDTLMGPAPGFEDCEISLRDWIVNYPIAGGVEWSGCLELARDATRSPNPIDWNDEGRVRVSGVVAGGTLNPAALVEALASTAVASGASFVNDASVLRVQNERGAIVIDATPGRVVVDRVLVAVDATAIDRHFNPWPVRFVTVALEIGPPGHDRLRAAGWHDGRPFYTNDLPLLWGRTGPRGELFIGRELVDVHAVERDTIEQRIAIARDRLLSRVRGLHPAFESVEHVRAWGGPIARSDAGVPSLCDDPRIRGALWAGGYGGHGLAAAFRLGSLAAQQLLM